MAAAACVEAAAAPRHPGAQPTRKRMRVAMGTTEDYEETRCLGVGSFGAVVKARHRVTGDSARTSPSSASTLPSAATRRSSASTFSSTRAPGTPS
ncbi:unnamed protein product [Urochloa humidicola]